MQNNFKPLKEIINIQHGYAFESSFFSTKKTDFILLTPGNFGKDQKLHFGEKTKFYNANPPEDYILNNGDLLVVMTDLTPSMEILGNCVQLESDTKILHNQRIGKIEFLSEKVDSLYLLYTLNSNNFRKFIKNTASGTTVRHTSPSRILENTILLPPLPEQKKIAAILSTWDRAIEGTEKLLANSQQQKKALMQQLLTGKKRLPGFTGVWETKFLGDIADIQTGSSNRQDSLTNGEYTFFDRSEDIRTSNRYLFDCEAVIVPGEGQDFVPKYFVGKFDLHQRTYAISCFQACDGKFIFYTVGYHRSHFLSQAVGSTVKSLRLPMFQKMPLKLPPLPEQRAIAAVLTTADEELAALESDLSRLRQEKKALMQQLLTGKRRVKID